MDGADASRGSLSVLADQLYFPDRTDEGDADCTQQKIVRQRKKRRKKEEMSGGHLIPAFCFMEKKEDSRSEICSSLYEI